MFSTPNHDSWLKFAGLAIADFPQLEAPRRRVWLASSFINQFKDMDSWSKDQDKVEGPKAQVQYILQHFAEGIRRLQDGFDYKLLQLSPLPVYELRTQDVRLFGFAIGRGEFCVVFACLKRILRNREDYNSLVAMVTQFVKNLKIPSPKFSKEPIHEIYR